MRSGSGFSLTEMKAIAAEVGIDPALVEQAARLVPVERRLSAFERVIGGPLKHHRDFRVPVELTEDQALRLLSTIRAVAEEHGEGEAHETGVTWSTKGQVSRVFVAAQSEKGDTRVRIGVDRGGGLLLTAFLNLTGGAVIASVVGAVLNPDSAAVGWAIFGSGIAGGLAVARSVWTTTTRRIRERLDDLVESISESLEDASASSPTTDEPGSSDPGAS